MYEFFKDKKKYIREPWRLRVHLAYVLMILFAVTADPVLLSFWIGTGMIAAGITIRAWASGIVKKDEQLAVEGPYSLSRNPLYVGNFLIGYGMCFLNGGYWAFGVITVYFVSIYPFTIRKERRKLKQLFGDEFEEYREHVPLFIPRLTPYDTLRGWSLKQYLVENKDVLNEAAVVLCWCIVYYHFT